MPEAHEEGVITLTETLIDEITKEEQTFREESAKSDQEFDTGDETEYYIVSTLFIEQWQDKIKSIQKAKASGYVNQKISVKEPQPMNHELIEEHLPDFNEFTLKRDLVEGKDYKFYNFSVLNLFSNYERKLIPRKLYSVGNERKVELYPIQFSFVYVSPSLISSLTNKEESTKPILKLYKSLAYKNEKVLDLRYRLVDYSKCDQKNRDEKFKNNTLAKLYLSLGLNVEEFTNKLLGEAASQAKGNLEPPGIEVDDVEKLVGDLDIPKEEFMLVVELQEKTWVYSSNLISSDRCEYCRKVDQLKAECVCKKVKYCNETCLNKDWRFHEKNCEAKLIEDNLIPEFKITEKSRLGLVGLSNLGNTCYMNAALQCLIHTKKLTEYFRTGQYLEEINEKNPIGSKGVLVKSYAKFIDLVISGENENVVASKLKFAIGKTKEMFSGFEQHDSQEFLLFILDTLHEDLNRVLEKPYTTGVENEGRPDEIVGKESWITYLKRNQSIINDLMGGQYRSEVKCPDCNNISVTFDPFLMFAVPIPSDDAKLINLYFFFTNFSRATLKMCLASKNNSVRELREDAAKKTNVPIEEIMFFVSGFNGSVRKVEDTETVDRLTNEKQLNEISEEKQLFALQFSKSEIENIQNKRFLNFKFMVRTDKVLTFKKPFPFDCKKIKGSDLYDRVLEYTMNVNNKSERKLDEKERKTKFDVFKTKSMQEEVFKILMSYGEQSEVKNKIHFKNQIPIEENTKVYELLQKYNYEVEFEVQYKQNPNFDFNNYQNHSDKKNMGDDEETQSGDNGSYTLEECLDEMKKSEKLLEGNEVFCSKCNDLKLAEKKMELYKASKYLIIQLRRFKQIGYEKSKNYSNVNFPINLDLQKHLLSPKSPETYFESDEEFFKKPKYWEGYDKSESTNYKLYGVVNHHGGLNGGHYTAFGQHENKWYKFDDSDVKEVKPESAVTSDAYLLFYEKVE